MARSHYIYVVTRTDRQEPGEAPGAAFTVKHEMITWLGKIIDPDRYRVWRVNDGPYQGAAPIEITTEILEALDGV